MKKNIHPDYFQTTVTCAGCGATFTTGSTVQNIRVDICSNCHPFYTGQKKLIDTEGRVERYERRMAQRQERKPKKTIAAVTTKTEAAPVDASRPKSLREMLQEAANTSQG